MKRYLLHYFHVTSVEKLYMPTSESDVLGKHSILLSAGRLNLLHAIGNALNFSKKYFLLDKREKCGIILMAFSGHEVGKATKGDEHGYLV
jgi:hypothetical protein